MLSVTSPSISKFIHSHPSLTFLETKCTTIKHLQQIHSHLIKSNLSDHPIVASRLLRSAAAFDLSYALLLFSHIPGPARSSFMYNTLLRALSKGPTPRLAISLFIDMLHDSSSSPPQRQTYPSLFIACGQLNSAGEGGSQLHGHVVKNGLVSDTYVHNSMIHMYATCGCLAQASALFDQCDHDLLMDPVPCNSMITGLAKKGLIAEARRLFDELPARNPITWSAMVSAYVRNGMNSDALELFRRMQLEKVEPNAQTLVSLLGACACLGALEQGGWIHSYIISSNKIELNLIVTNAIIHMYCKCGSIAKARQVFDNNAFAKGVSTWNTMMSGLAMHGRGREAIRLFSRLLTPDRVSFLSILNACSHSGLVDEALQYFKMMEEDYDIEPGIEHYGCLVDALARAGRIQEAKKLIDKMPVEPDVMAWGALLSACRDIGHTEVGEEAASRIAGLDKGDSGGYLMLSNGYARVERFVESTRVRVVMGERGVSKEVGGSVMEVDGCVHEFVSGGMLHCEAKGICAVLSGLHLNMREGKIDTDDYYVGFVPCIL